MESDSKVIIIQKLARGFLTRKKIKQNDKSKLKGINENIFSGIFLVDYDPFDLIQEIEYKKKTILKVSSQTFQVFNKPLTELLKQDSSQSSIKNLEFDHCGYPEELIKYSESLIELEKKIILILETTIFEAEFKVNLNIEKCSILSFDKNFNVCELRSLENDHIDLSSFNDLGEAGIWPGESKDEEVLENEKSQISEGPENFSVKVNLDLELEEPEELSNEIQAGIPNEFIPLNKRNIVKLPSLAGTEVVRPEKIDMNNFPNLSISLSPPVYNNIQTLPELDKIDHSSKKYIKENKSKDTPELPNIKYLSTLPIKGKSTVKNSKIPKRFHKDTFKSGHSKSHSRVKQLSDISLTENSFYDSKHNNEDNKKTNFSKTQAKFNCPIRHSIELDEHENKFINQSAYLDSNSMLRASNYYYSKTDQESNSLIKNERTIINKEQIKHIKNPSFTFQASGNLLSQAALKDPSNNPVNSKLPCISLPKTKTKQIRFSKIKNLLKKKQIP